MYYIHITNLCNYNHMYYIHTQLKGANKNIIFASYIFYFYSIHYYIILSHTLLILLYIGWVTVHALHFALFHARFN